MKSIEITVKVDGVEVSGFQLPTSHANGSPEWRGKALATYLSQIKLYLEMKAL